MTKLIGAPIGGFKEGDFRGFWGRGGGRGSCIRIDGWERRGRRGGGRGRGGGC